MTVTRTRAGSVERIDAAWLSDASGNVSQVIGIQGIITRVVTNPGATAPTDNYSLTIPDEFGIDLLKGLGTSNRDTSASEDVVGGVGLGDGVTTSVMPITHIGDVTLTIAGAGNAKVGVITLFVKK